MRGARDRKLVFKVYFEWEVGRIWSKRKVKLIFLSAECVTLYVCQVVLIGPLVYWFVFAGSSLLKLL